MHTYVSVLSTQLYLGMDNYLCSTPPNEVGITDHIVVHNYKRKSVQGLLFILLLGGRCILEKRRVLYWLSSQAPKSLVSQMLKDTSEIDDTRLAMEIDVVSIITLYWVLSASVPSCATCHHSTPEPLIAKSSTAWRFMWTCS